MNANPLSKVYTVTFEIYFIHKPLPFDVGGNWSRIKPFTNHNWHGV